MSFAIDVNILLYATDASCSQHARAKAFIEQCVARRSIFCLAWITIFSYLRMATHPSIFAQPLSPAQAQRNIEQLLALPHCQTLAEAEGFWAEYRALATTVNARANLVPDIHLAAMLRQHGISTLYTHDREFRKFDFLSVVDPVN